MQSSKLMDGVCVHVCVCVCVHACVCMCVHVCEDCTEAGLEQCSNKELMGDRRTAKCRLQVKGTESQFANNVALYSSSCGDLERTAMLGS